MIRFLFLLALLYLLGCAAPRELKPVLDESEVSVIALAREGYSNFSKGRYLEAETFFRKALYLDPGLRNIRENLALTLSQLGQFEEARDEYLRLSRDYPGSLRIISSMARNEAAAEEYETAEQLYFQALERAEELEAWDEYAKFLSALSSVERARGDSELARCYAEEAFRVKEDLKYFLAFSRLLLLDGLYSRQESEGQLSFRSEPNARLLTLVRLVSEGKGVEAVEYQELVKLGAKKLENAFQGEWATLNAILERYGVTASESGPVLGEKIELDTGFEDEDEESEDLEEEEEELPEVDWAELLTAESTEYWTAEIVGLVQQLAEESETEESGFALF